MINKAMFKQVQSFKRQGYAKSAIIKALELDPRTVAKYFAMEEEVYRAYRQDHLFRDKAFDDMRSEILEVYEANGFRPLQASSIYDYLEEKIGVLPGNEQTLRNYVAYLIRTDGLRLDENVRLYTKVPELPFGKQMQVDFGRYRCRSGLVLYIFAAVLSASRYKYVIFQGQPFRRLDVIRHLLDCFDYFGGRPESLGIRNIPLIQPRSTPWRNPGTILHALNPCPQTIPPDRMNRQPPEPLPLSILPPLNSTPFRYALAKTAALRTINCPALPHFTPLK